MAEVTHEPSLNRRSFLRLSAVATGSGLILQVNPLGVIALGKDGDNVFAPNIWVKISTEGDVSLVCHRSEMGQGARTAMIMLLAEELDVDPESVKVIQAPGDETFGDQNTDGSTSVRENWQSLREAGASARAMLVAAAAAEWRVPPETCTTQAGQVIHEKKQLSYGSLASKAAKQPLPKKPRLKAPQEFRYVGKPRKSIDLENIINGTSVFGIDVTLPGLLYASIERSPTRDGQVVAVIDEKARAVKGVRNVVRLAAQKQPINTSNSIAVVADTYFAAVSGRQLLEVKWTSVGNLESTNTQRGILEKAIAGGGKTVRNEGDVDLALKKAKDRISATYYAPYLVHAPMEPLACTAHYKGNTCEVWAPTQDPQRARKAVADALNLPVANVTINVTMLGGGFGRKSQPDFVVEAALLSKEIKSPVKVVWTREDEIRHGFYHAESLQTLEAGFNSVGEITAWKHVSAFPTIMTTFDAKAAEPADFEIGMGAKDLPYQIPNIKVAAAGVPSSLRIGWLRAVCHVFHSFAINCFFDEIAEARRVDPIDLRLALLPKGVGKSKDGRTYEPERMRRVIELVRDKSKYDKRREGITTGFACHYSFFSYVATVASVSKTKDGFQVIKIDTAIDPGIMVNPDSVRAQIEGASIFGLSLALLSRISVTKGVVIQSNFHDYPVMRLNESPEIAVHFVESDRDPMGVGEPGVPPVAPAVCNGIYRITGKRIRELPINA